MADPERTIENIVPILRVADMARSLACYEQVLGFTRAPWGDTFTQVSRDGWGLYLCEGDQGQPGTWVWIGVEDVQVLHAELAARGADIVLPPTNYPHALEMRVQDPDGHVLRFGSGPLDDQPFAEMT